MNEMIRFFNELSNATASAAATGTLYPRDLGYGTDWMSSAAGSSSNDVTACICAMFITIW